VFRIHIITSFWCRCILSHHHPLPTSFIKEGFCFFVAINRKSEVNLLATSTKMQVASCQVFSLIGLVGLLMFFTSFLTIDFHVSNEHPGVHKGHEFFHAPRTKGEFVSDADPVTRTVGAVMDSLKHMHDIHPAEAEAADRLADQHLPLAPSATDDAHIETPGQDAPKAKPFPAREANELKVTAPDQADNRCKVTFQPKCRINPLVKYWDEVMECYTSPFRDLVGLDAPLEGRKFVVFQADSGGWNNIRMALEVVILFAQVGFMLGYLLYLCGVSPDRSTLRCFSFLDISPCAPSR